MDGVPFSTDPDCRPSSLLSRAYGRGMSSVPTWAVLALGFFSPVAALLGVLIGHRVSRRGAFELDRRSKREESMRTLRWASELAFADDGRTRHLGAAALRALETSPWLHSEDQGFLDDVLEALAVLQDADYRSRDAARPLVFDYPPAAAAVSDWTREEES